MCLFMHILQNYYTQLLNNLEVLLVDNIWPESERKENSEEPSWVHSEKDQFRVHRDKDKDGKLNKVTVCTGL